MLEQHFVRTPAVLNLKLSNQLCCSATQPLWDFGRVGLEYRVDLFFTKSVVLKRLDCLMWIDVPGEDVVEPKLPWENVHHYVDGCPIHR